MEAAQLWKQWKESRIGSKSDRATKLNKVGRHHFKFEIREHHFYWVFDISLWLTEQEQELTVARCSNLSFKKTSAEISISVAHFKALLLSKIQIVCWSLLFFCWLLKVNLSVRYNPFLTIWPQEGMKEFSELIFTPFLVTPYNG